MAHDHASGHSHDGHSHGVSADADRGKLAIALGLIIGFMAVEVTVGILASDSERASYRRAVVHAVR
jgi:cobalt-zinc-cadmium efflux system protein